MREAQSEQKLRSIQAVHVAMPLGLLSAFAFIAFATLRFPTRERFEEMLTRR